MMLKQMLCESVFEAVPETLPFLELFFEGLGQEKSRLGGKTPKF
jgi:hypothetical protein